jgi:hypothetical protein
LTGPAAAITLRHPRMFDRLVEFFLGRRKDIRDPGIYHRMALIPFLAWVGLGADGLSSSSYGPDEAFRALGEHTYLSVGLAVATAITVFIISYSYSRIIENFPAGGGGYVVATKLLGSRIGLVSGSALLVDYVLTITVSIASGADAVFSFLPPGALHYKLSVAIAAILLLVLINLRGVKESVVALMPIFLVFLATHVTLIGYGLLSNATHLPEVAGDVTSGFRHGVTTLGIGGLFMLFLRAYSLGGGTYTGIEAVSNGLAIMREPKVETGKRTMVYMAISLAATAGGILVCYLLARATPAEGKTMNAVHGRAARGRLAPGPFAARPCVHRHHAVRRGGAAVRRRAGGLHRRAARHGQHGVGLVAAAPLLRALRSPDDAERRAPHGRRRARRAPLHQGLGERARGHVLDQRLRHLLAVRDRDDALLCHAPRRPP